MDEQRPRWGEAAIRFVTVVALGLVAVVPIIGNELRVQDVDAIYMRNLVERASVYGGTFYENTIHNRGTFEPLLFDLPTRLISYDGYWFVISFIVAVLAAILGFVAARTAIATGANRSVAIGVAAVVYVQFALADHPYSRVLYIRNITTCLLVLTWLIALSARAWSSPRRARWSSIAVGALLGLLVEQLLTSVFCGAVVGLVALALLYERRPPEERGGLLLRAGASGVLAFLVTPAWYLARGGFEEYWSGWWTYARFMGDGPGRSLGSQFALGWDRAWEYHLRNPLVVALLVAFLGTTWMLWSAFERRVRVVHVGLIAWYLAGWLELVLSQRYSGHYYMVIAVPTALMGAALAGHATRAVAAHRPSARASLAVPLAATMLAVYMTGPAIFVQDVKDTNRFSGVSAWARDRENYVGGGDRSVRSVLDLVSERNDGLLAWTFDPFVYTRYQRVPATRFQWKFLLQGAIYLGRTSPDYVLPHTWTWFAEDVAESHPAAFVETEPFDPHTPFDELIRTHYVETFPTSAGKVWLTRAAAKQLTDSQPGTPWIDPGERIDGTGWTVEGDGARFVPGPIPTDNDGLYLTSGPCVRIEGDADVDAPGALADLIFRFESKERQSEERQTLALEGAKAGSGSRGLGPLGFESLDANVLGDGPVHFAVIIGRRSAALVVNGEVQAAVRLRDTVMHLTLESRTPDVTISGLRLGRAPAGGGCAGSPTLPAP